MSRGVRDDTDRLRARELERISRGVHATTKIGVWGGWIGSCTKCTETIAGSSIAVHVWADVHNEDSHREPTP